MPRQPDPVLGSAFDFGLVLGVDLSREQLLIFLHMAQPLLQLGGGGSAIGRRLLIQGCVLGVTVLRFQLLAQTHDLGMAGNRLLLQLQHHVLQLVDLALQLVQGGSVVAGLGWGLGGARTRQERSQPKHP